MNNHEVVHVAALPPSVAQADQTQSVASIIGKDFGVTRLLLAGSIPRVVAHYHSRQQAESTVQRLRDLGLAAIACTDAQLRKVSDGLRTHAIEFGRDQVVFVDRIGRFVKLESGLAWLIISGSVEICEERRVTTTSKKLNLPATLLAGGIPIRRKVTEQTTKTDWVTERFARVYGRPPELVAEMRQYDLDYSRLGSKMTLSSIANFGSVVAGIRSAFPKARFDDGLTKPFAVDLPFDTVWDKATIACNLLVLFHQLYANSVKQG